MSGGNSKEVFHVYPFAAFRSYSISLLIFLLGVRLLLLVGSPITDFDGALILGFIIAIIIISVLKPYRVDIYTISKMVLIAVFLSSPLLIKLVAGPVKIYLPWDAYMDFLRSTFSTRGPTQYGIAVAIFSGGILGISYSVISTWRFKFYLEGGQLVMEEVFPSRYTIRVPLTEIVNVEVEQTNFQKAFDYGDVRVVTSRGEVYELGLIERPIRFKNLIFEGVREIYEKELKRESESGEKSEESS